MPFDADLIDQANALVMAQGGMITNLKPEKIKEMISQFSMAESASVVFDAIDMKTPDRFYNEPGGRPAFYNSIKYKKEFLEKLLPLVEFIDKTKKEMLQAKQP